MALVDRDSFVSRLLSTRLVRGIADALFRRRAAKRLRRLDTQAADRVQRHVLEKIVNQGCNTRFGREHDFARIRTVEDFRRLVPLRTAGDLWRHYGGPSVPNLDGVSWPGHVPYLATCECPAGQRTPPLLVTDDLIQGHRSALLTALAHVIHVRPHARLLSGTLLLVGGGTALTPLRGAGSSNLEELTRSQLPALLRPYTEVAPYSGDGSLVSLAEHAASLPVTCLVGNTGRLARLAAILRRKTGRDSLTDVWPGLEAVLFSRGPIDPDRESLSQLIGSRRSRLPVLLLEGCIRPEGVLAIEDPRYGFPRLPADHGIYFEFVPVDELGRSQPRRLGLEEVQPGVPYALALSCAAGLWSCLIGLTATFESLSPPLFRSIEYGHPAAMPSEILPLRTDSPTAAQPRPQTGDTPAAPARRIARTPWSARADQG
jgi:hypothetical protein